ncbi:MAG: hypothetical protein H7138_04855 [Myxococcales bacterium]|nr:hypothetical protein [Myxococcales bacterium]
MFARLLLLLPCLAACFNDDAFVAGDYAITVTNRTNGCNFGNWTPGDAAASSVTITQNRNDVSASVTGLGALALEVAIGGHVFTGKVAGGTLSLNLLGTRSYSTGNCTYTYNGEIRATLDGNLLEGQLEYRAATNGNPDCAGITDCLSFQEFTGTRPQMIYNSVTAAPRVSGPSAPPTAR